MKLINSRTASKVTLIVSVLMTVIGMYVEYGNVIASDFIPSVTAFLHMWLAETMLMVLAKPNIKLC